MSQERWRPSWLENKPNELPSDTPEYWQQQSPGVERREALGMALVVQLGDAAEMFEHIQYDNLDESPYFQENPEYRAIAPLIQKFVRFVRETHPSIPDNQVIQSIRAALYDPGVLDIIGLLDQMDKASHASSADVTLQWFERVGR